tara:strand:+ start:9898 stop:11040 length:1143 start_codon:yes stop_codon:yes gene_type:complete
MENLSTEAENNYIKHVVNFDNKTEEEAREDIKNFNNLSDSQVKDLNALLISTPMNADFNTLTAEQIQIQNNLWESYKPQINSIESFEATNEDNFEQEFAAQSVIVDENLASIEQLYRNTGNPIIGSFDPEDSRFAEFDNLRSGGKPRSFEPSPAQQKFITKDEEQIVADVTFMIQNLPESEQKLLAMELAVAGYYTRYGGHDAVFNDDDSLNLRAYGKALGEAIIDAQQFQPTGNIQTGSVQGMKIKVPSQVGLGISYTYNILTGQSGLSGEEIVQKFEESQAEAAMETVQQFDPATLMRTVNEVSKSLLGQNATETQKNKFVEAMVGLVKTNAVNNMDRPDPVIQAEMFLDTADGAPEQMDAAKKGRAVNALRRAVLGR